MPAVNASSRLLRKVPSRFRARFGLAGRRCLTRQVLESRAGLRFAINVLLCLGIDGLSVATGRDTLQRRHGANTRTDRRRFGAGLALVEGCGRLHDTDPPGNVPAGGCV